MLGEKIRVLRESKGMLQRQIAAKLSVDTAYISKMENNDKPVSRIHLKKLSIIFGIAENELLPFWVAEKIKKAIKHEDCGRHAIEIVLKELNNG